MEALEIMQQGGSLMTMKTSTLATLQDNIGGDLITASHAEYDNSPMDGT